MNISFREFEMDKSVVAKCIYDNKPHCTTNVGVALSNDVVKELTRFLASFNESVGMGINKPKACLGGPYYRIDAYFDENCLHILEINAAFVDGWGTAFNLARASGIVVPDPRPNFPQMFASENRIYSPELELLTEELWCYEKKTYDNAQPQLRVRDKTVPTNYFGFSGIYVYGRIDDNGGGFYPYDGVRLDNKHNLGLFSQTWSSDLVKVPRHYMAPENLWEEVPPKAILKFCDKGSKECKRAFQSVILGKPSGKAPFLKRCYREGKMLAQDIVKPAKQGNKNCQLIILAIGDTPITGYVQYSWEKVINDDSTHGPSQLGDSFFDDGCFAG